mgnify:CR=1 FL=1
MASKRKKRAIIFCTVAVAVAYIGLWIFPARMIYDFRKVEAAVYAPGSVKVFEIRKKFVLFPGPHALWALKTPEGCDVYRDLPAFKREERGRALSFPIDNFIKSIFTRSNVLSHTTELIHSKMLLFQRNCLPSLNISI